MSDTTLNNLLERHAAFLSFVQRRVNDRALAEDILQSAYIRAMERAGSLREQDSAVAWFYSILRHAIVDHFRRSSTESGALERWATELEHAPVEDVSDAFTRGLVCRCIETVLPGMNAGYAEILREVDLAEKPLAEYAEDHGITPGNAAVRAHRARAALKRELAKTCGICSQHACLDCTCKHTADAVSGSESVG